MADKDAISGVHLEEIAQAGLTVTDLARARVFYGERLGMKFLLMRDDGLLSVWRSAANGGSGGRACNSGWNDSLLQGRRPAGCHAALVEQAVPSLQPPHLVAKMPDHELSMAFLKGPDGRFWD